MTMERFAMRSTEPRRHARALLPAWIRPWDLIALASLALITFMTLSIPQRSQPAESTQMVVASAPRRGSESLAATCVRLGVPGSLCERSTIEGNEVRLVLRVQSGPASAEARSPANGRQSGN